VNESTEGKKDDPHPADDPEPTTQCQYVFDRDSARWRAQRTSPADTRSRLDDEK
jgi:hypothetical protein